MLPIDQTIAVLTGAATLATALATFLTVREIARQRQASYRPELVAANEVCKGLAESGDPLRAFRWVNPKDESSSAPDLMDSWHGVTFFNLGMAAAKSIEADWRMDIASHIKAFNELAQRCLTPIYSQYSDKSGILKIEGKSGLQEVHMVRNQIHHAWPHLLPASIDRSGLVVPLPSFLLRLYSLGLTLQLAQEREKPGLFDLSFIPSATLELKYADLGGRIHTKYFQLRLDLHHAVQGNVDAEGRHSLSECLVSVKLEEA